MPAERRNFNDRLSPIIYWDATFSIAFTDKTHGAHDDCRAFALRLEAEGSLSVASDFTYNELAFFAIRRRLAAEGRRHGLHWAELYKAQPDALQLAVPDMDAAIAALDAATLHLATPTSVRDSALQLIREFNLLPTDAYHIAVALEADVNTFVTLDEDFLRVDGIIVYTTTSPP
jgi:predicted nucleic acid-binding protein